MVEWIVEKSEAGGRLDKFLKARLKSAPDSFFYKMARKKNLLLNDKKCTCKEILSTGDHIKLYVSDDTIALFSGNVSNDSLVSSYRKAYDTLKGIQIVKEYDDFLFLYKPSGILSQKAKNTDISLNEWLIGYLLDKEIITEESLNVFRPSVLNRLDRNTCGLVICGKTPSGSRLGSDLLKKRTLHKFYHCIVEGECRLKGDYSGYLYKNESENIVSFYKTQNEIPADVLPKVKAVSLGIKVIETKGGKSLLEIELYTGKSHQIRVMLSNLGYPIAGDPKYSGKNDNRRNKDNYTGQKLCAVRYAFPAITGDFEYLSNQIISCKPPFSLDSI